MECGGMLFKTCRKINNCFLLHYKQSGGPLALPVNISRRREIITIYSINYSIHKNSYDLFDAEKTIRSFNLAVKNKFVPEGKVKV